MRIFVTGASGVIGRRVVPLLLSRGHSVTAGVRNGSPRSTIFGATPVVVDLFDVDALKRAVSGHDAVVNLATHMPSSMWKMLFRSAWRLNDRIRTEGVANLVDSACNGGASRFVQESFALAYPDRGDDWIGEDTALSPSAYNKTLLDAEASVERFARTGAAGVTLRFAAFYGPDAMQVRTYIDSLRHGWAALPGGRRPYTPSISHDDAAAAVVAALDIPGGAYTVVDDEPLRRSDFFGTLARQLHLPPPRFLPEWMTPLFGSVGDAMARSLRLSNAKLKHAAKWAPRFTSVRDGWPYVLGRT